jgi:hypothetical protein
MTHTRVWRSSAPPATACSHTRHTRRRGEAVRGLAAGEPPSTSSVSALATPGCSRCTAGTPMAAAPADCARRAPRADSSAAGVGSAAVGGPAGASRRGTQLNCTAGHTEQGVSEPGGHP